MTTNNLIPLLRTSFRTPIVNHAPQTKLTPFLSLHNLNFHNLQIRSYKLTPVKCWKCNDHKLTSSFLLSHNYQLSHSFNFQVRNCSLTSVKCWKCGVERKSPTRDLFCESCGIIQKPPETEDYFGLFGLGRRFDVDERELTRRYRRLQAVLHPDRFASAPAEERRLSEECSSLVNRAYGALRAPLGRALYMLRVDGVVLDEITRADDPEFLAEMMELNEELEAADNEERLRAVDRKNRETLQEVSEVISRCFKEGNVEEAKKAVIRMRYYDSLGKRINGLLREKGIVD